MSEAKHTTETEEWRAVLGYEGRYEVSNLGRVRTLSRIIPGGKGYAPRFCKGRHLRIQKHRDGHLLVFLHRNGMGKTGWVHRLVLEAFVGPCPEGMVCRHFPDRDPTNNRLDNLQWGTPAENSADMITHGTSTKGRSLITTDGRAKIAESNRTRICTAETRKKRSLNAVRLAKERAARKECQR